jgi:hypothetical protein
MQLLQYSLLTFVVAFMIQYWVATSSKIVDNSLK